jgi:uncharacterized membrane protein YphA (DoxX/SURF4 family)
MDSHTTDQEQVGKWVSLLLRLAVASLFFAAAVGKFKGGAASLSGVVGYFQQTFAETWLPKALVTLHARITPFIEATLFLWLLIGHRLRIGWIVAALFMTSLAFGMSVAGKHDVAAHNYTYVLMFCVGLYFSRYDRYSADGCCACTHDRA